MVTILRVFLVFLVSLYARGCDSRAAKCNQKQKHEIDSLEKNQKHLAARVKDSRQLLAVATESKEATASLLRSNIVRTDDLQKEIERLKVGFLGNEKLNAKIEELSLALRMAENQLEKKEKEHNESLDKLKKEVEHLRQAAYLEQVSRNVEKAH